MKTLILLVLSLSVLGCFPLLAGGVVGYEVNQYQRDRDHEEWMRRERQRLEYMQWENDYWRHRELKRGDYQ